MSRSRGKSLDSFYNRVYRPSCTLDTQFSFSVVFEVRKFSQNSLFEKNNEKCQMQIHWQFDSCFRLKISIHKTETLIKLAFTITILMSKKKKKIFQYFMFLRKNLIMELDQKIDKKKYYENYCAKNII
jgi:hypothetical protein